MHLDETGIGCVHLACCGHYTYLVNDYRHYAFLVTASHVPLPLNNGGNSFDVPHVNMYLHVCSLCSGKQPPHYYSHLLRSLVIYMYIHLSL